jgi:hypothetical protein
MPNLNDATNELDNNEEVIEEVETKPEESKGNPAWEGLRSQLDPISFSRIEPELTKFDQAAQQRVQASNEALKPWKEFADQGVTPEQLRSALNITRSIDESPEEVYQYLGNFLQETGRMPTQEEVQDASDAGEIGGENQQLQDPRFDQLAEQQEQMQAFLEYQAEQDVMRTAEADLDTEIDSFKTAHADVSPEDLKDILGRAAFVAQQPANLEKGFVPTLEEVYTGWFSELRNRILSTPRPGTLAPKLLPTNGGAPSAGQPTQGLGQLSRQQVQDLIAADIAANNSSGR